ncbi:MAG TPA: hypothetical protein VER09_02750 [Pseudomonas sp.]|nr:hypothetical protein [Pseudomonas sp.]
MTSKPNTPEATAPCQDEQTTAADSPQAATPAFRFPFSPATYAPKQSDDQPWHQRNNKSNHDKRPGMAPRGTRRSMGKR